MCSLTSFNLTIIVDCVVSSQIAAVKVAYLYTCYWCLSHSIGEAAVRW
jgi:hypothetical protein